MSSIQGSCPSPSLCPPASLRPSAIGLIAPGLPLLPKLSLGRRLGAFVAALRRELRVRRGARDLAALSDAMLHDIGVPRGAAESAARNGRRDPASLEWGPTVAPPAPPTWTEWR